MGFAENVWKVQRALEEAGIIFIDEDDIGGVCVARRRRQWKKYQARIDPRRLVFLASAFLRQSGGHIAVVASDDGRATLKILLPRHGEAAERTVGAAEAEPAPEPAPAPEALTETEAAARRTAIVVEPDPDVRRMTASLLRQLDYEVMDSGDAEDAIAYGDEAPADLLVAESRLPGPWTGETLAARLRRMAPNLRVVLTSDTGLGASGASFGEAALLQKPFGLDELSALVKWRDTNE